MHWWCFIPFHSSLIILTLHCVDGGVGNSSSSSYTPSSTCVISSHSPSFILASSSCGWWCRKFAFFFLHTIICTCHLISLIIIHSYSLLCGWWCRKFIFFFLHTIICTCHLISLICSFHCLDLLHLCKTINTRLLVCSTSLITTLSFPFSLHMPLITTFSSGLWLYWSLITTFLLVQWVGRRFGRKNLLG